jgi:hypothetical protein
MTKNLGLILIMGLFFLSSRLNAQNGWTEAVGEYFLNDASNSVFSEFYFFALETSDYWKYLDTSRSYVHLIPSDSNDCVDCTINEIRMTDDSLSFTTKQCQGNQYMFSGKYTVPLGEVYHNMHKTVLEGILYWYKKGRLFQKGNVSFTFESGC